MKPVSIRTAAASLGADALNRYDARSSGVAFGRPLAAQLRAQRTVQDRLYRSAAFEIEMALLELAAGHDENIAEVAEAALAELRQADARIRSDPV